MVPSMFMQTIASSESTTIAASQRWGSKGTMGGAYWKMSATAGSACGGSTYNRQGAGRYFECWARRSDGADSFGRRSERLSDLDVPRARRSGPYRERGGGR